ncbi:hypothetical protein SPF06_00005 [Sinomonas sp. JGH33]|uniref:Uncharacterized protein n=1 Tax=Sinomonas terricola TaxID=3110330 RepID=A0ABU5T0A2_9MICC|nr:hypothetical protein [Sinomonas sp. JGH33]MEA5453090.1 hypothetical protein [Sinomonas sp. JGH33]
MSGGRRRGLIIRSALGLAVGVLAAAVTLAARRAGWLEGTWVNALFFAVLLALPTARSLARRITLALALLLGLVPMLWWIPFGFWGLGRSAVLLALAIGLLAGLVIGNRRLGVRQIVPELALLDLAPLGAGVLGVVVQWQLLTVRTFDKALSLAVLHWDHASHFNMFSMIRTHGVVIPLLGNAPDGSAWSFRDYPQGFHALVAALAEMARTPAVGDAGAELVSYANYSSLVAVLTGVLAVSAVCSLPALRRRPLLGFPAAALVTSGWVFGPGASASLNGFTNFLVAAVLTAVAVLVLATAQDRFSFGTVWLLTACVVGIANNWALMGVFLAGAAISFVLPWRRLIVDLPRTPWSITSFALAVAVMLAGVMAAGSQLIRVKAEDVVFGIGGVPIPDFGTVIAVLFACVVAFAVPLGAMSREQLQTSRRLVLAGLSLAAAIVLILAMSAAQLLKGGTVSYYTHKLVIALVLVAVVVLALGLARIADGRTDVAVAEVARRRHPKGSWAVVTAAGSLVGLFAFGFPFPFKTAGLPATASAGVELQAQLKENAQPRTVARNLIDATAGRTGQPAFYLTTRPDQIDAVLAKQWYDALTSTYTEHGWKLSLFMFPLSGGPANLPSVVADIRAQDPSSVFITDPADKPLLDRALGL